MDYDAWYGQLVGCLQDLDVDSYDEAEARRLFEQGYEPADAAGALLVHENHVQLEAARHQHGTITSSVSARRDELIHQLNTWEGSGVAINHIPDRQLGRMTPLPRSPAEAILETVPNPHPGVTYVTRFTCPEFTSLCPVTGQPDFAHLVIDYVPDKILIESKSLKLYLGSFRNHGAFHEDCTIGIARTLVGTAFPKWLRIAGYWYPRGGIPIDVFWQTGSPLQGVWVPDSAVPPYRGRG